MTKQTTVRGWFAALLPGIAVMLALQAGAMTPPPALVREAVEWAAKISGRTLAPAAREASELALRQAAARHGTQMLNAARVGGLELIEQAAKHGDDVWRLCAHAPGSARSLALNADTLLPLARRVGPELMTLEAKAPGLAARAVANFGDDGARLLANTANPSDLPRLIGYAERADSPATRDLLLRTYNETGGKILQKLDWKSIMAGGLSASAITFAYQTGDGLQEGVKSAGEGVREGLVTIANTDPEALGKTVVNLAAVPFKYVALPFVLFTLAIVAVRMRRKRTGLRAVPVRVDEGKLER